MARVKVAGASCSDPATGLHPDKGLPRVILFAEVEEHAALVKALADYATRCAFARVHGGVWRGLGLQLRLLLALAVALGLTPAHVWHRASDRDQCRMLRLGLGLWLGWG